MSALQVGSRPNNAKNAASSWGFPLVVKPACGTGGEKSALLQNEQDLKEFLKSKNRADLKDLIVKPFVEGMPAGLSFLISQSRMARLISVNEQKIALDEKGDSRPQASGTRREGQTFQKETTSDMAT